MLNGIIFVKDAIISLDLKILLSKNYHITQVFKKNIATEPLNMSVVDFIIFDSDFYSDLELHKILEKLNVGSDVKIVNITTNPRELKPQVQIRDSRKVMLPYTHFSIIQAIEEKNPTITNQEATYCKN